MEVYWRSVVEWKEERGRKSLVWNVSVVSATKLEARTNF